METLLAERDAALVCCSRLEAEVRVLRAVAPASASDAASLRYYALMDETITLRREQAASHSEARRLMRELAEGQRAMEKAKAEAVSAGTAAERLGRRLREVEEDAAACRTQLAAAQASLADCNAARLRSRRDLENADALAEELRLECRAMRLAANTSQHNAAEAINDLTAQVERLRGLLELKGGAPSPNVSGRGGAGSAAATPALGAALHGGGGEVGSGRTSPRSTVAFGEEPPHKILSSVIMRMSGLARMVLAPAGSAGAAASPASGSPGTIVRGVHMWDGQKEERFKVEG